MTPSRDISPNPPSPANYYSRTPAVRYLPTHAIEDKTRLLNSTRIGKIHTEYCGGISVGALQALLLQGTWAARLGWHLHARRLRRESAVHVVTLTPIYTCAVDSRYIGIALCGNFECEKLPRYFIFGTWDFWGEARWVLLESWDVIFNVIEIYRHQGLSNMVKKSSFILHFPRIAILFFKGLDRSISTLWCIYVIIQIDVQIRSATPSRR